MADNSLILSSKNTERKVLIVALVLSLLFHLLLLLFIKFDLFKFFDIPEAAKDTHEPVTFVFPENNPRQVVENINENGEKPDKSDLLSDNDSRARSDILMEQRGDQPYSEGNTDLMNMSKPEAMAEHQNDITENFRESEEFYREALLEDDGAGAVSKTNRQKYVAPRITPERNNRPGTNNMLNQRDLSSDLLGDISLSTYAWEWTPYMNAFKRKLYENWRVPSGYYLFGIKGKTIIEFTIDRSGNLVRSQVLSHEGHESLRVSSELVIKKCFPLQPLPVSFPDDSLNVQFTLLYPGVEKRIR